MSDRTIDGDDIFGYIRLLGELYAVGLTEEQYNFLHSSADLTHEEVDSLLEFADQDYETIKDLLAKGYKLMPRGTTFTENDIEVKCFRDENLEAIVFLSSDDLNLDQYTDERNELFDELLVGGKFSLGENYGLYYRSLFENLPFVVEGDIPWDTCAECVGELEDEENSLED